MAQRGSILKDFDAEVEGRDDVDTCGPSRRDGACHGSEGSTASTPLLNRWLDPGGRRRLGHAGGARL